MFNKLTVTALIALFVSFGANAGEPKGSHASSEWQIWAYTTAAPSFIGDFATVIGADGTVLREGTNGWRCEAFMPMPEAGLKDLMMPRQLVLIKTLWHGPMPTKQGQFQKWKVMDGCG